MAGAVRFAVEFLRINTPVVGVLTVAHLGALLAIVVGLVLLATARRALDRKPDTKRVRARA
jgi:prolipoprotein diacylglyceryltransferase